MVQRQQMVSLDGPLAQLDSKPTLYRDNDYKAQFVSFKFNKDSNDSDTVEKDSNIEPGPMVQQLMRNMEIRERAIMPKDRIRFTSASGWISKAEMDIRHRKGTAERVRYILE